ncbi:hypothetical protein GQX73_g10492 [Xylaria multiplex]|uniref:Uncharacterized protein n=1 Tax=Xylaria multiplex TaxID=323545 RepID=A0A7C8IK58_9PEZI|nr:hypothetical protein GQX73_g10492 [Xylaria multiplex]
MLSFGNQAFWQCSELAASEVSPDGALLTSLENRSNDATYHPFWMLEDPATFHHSDTSDFRTRWMHTFSTYCESNLTYPEKDAFAALNGIGAELLKISGGRFMLFVAVGSYGENKVLLESSNVDASCEPFRIRLRSADRFPIVRPKVDWFFFENYVTALAAKSFMVVGMPLGAHMLRVSTVVFKLEDPYRGIYLSPRGDGRPMEPWRVDRRVVVRYIRRMSVVFGALVDYNAQLQKCMILVGEFQPSVRPSDLRGISVEWVSPENESSINTQREWHNNLLRSPDGQVRPADVGHEKGSMRSEWLAFTEGGIWREDTGEGRAWLRTASGHWWLASIPGSPWLETPQGL